MSGYTYDKDVTGIVTVTLDKPDKPVNLMDAQFGATMDEILARLQAEEDLKGVIIASAKSTFFAGGDIALLNTLEDMPAAYKLSEELKRRLRGLEQLGKPVVAAINGAALGGGLELALACHGRVVLRGEKTKLGFPEVGLGLLPGAGGVVRLVRMVGLKKALPYLMQGTRIDADTALKEGWVDAAVDTPEEMFAAARQFIADHPEPVKPWDQKRESLPGGKPYVGPLADVVLGTFAQTFKAVGREPAPHAILAAATEGAMAGFDAASRIESRYFAKLAVTDEAKQKLSAFLAA